MFLYFFLLNFFLLSLGIELQIYDFSLKNKASCPQNPFLEPITP